MKRTFEFVLVLTVLAIGAAAAQDRAAFPEHRGPYLALGDSDPFGYNQFLTNLAAAAYGLPPTIPLPDVLLSYSGYPQDVSELLKLDLTNASCPGQTSSGFLYYPPPVLEPDNGCDQWRAARSAAIRYICLRFRKPRRDMRHPFLRRIGTRGW